MGVMELSFLVVFFSFCIYFLDGLNVLYPYLFCDVYSPGKHREVYNANAAVTGQLDNNQKKDILPTDIQVCLPLGRQ